MSGTDNIMLSCANCGKGEEKSNKLKKCSACLSVKYCSAACQKAHRPQHKKICKRRAAELYDEKLFKEVEREECPICMLPMPIGGEDTTVESCCGKRICSGCIYAMYVSEGKALCPFCRTPAVCDDEVHIEQTKKLMAKGCAEAFHLLAGVYAKGAMGLRQDFQKCIELNLKAGELGCAGAYYNLAVAYHEGRGVAIDKKKAKHYWELAAMGGVVKARHNLGYLEGEVGNHQRAMKHYKLAARAGFKESVDMVKKGFMKGLVTKDEYANTLRTYYDRQKEMKNDMRDKAAKLSAMIE